MLTKYFTGRHLYAYETYLCNFAHAFQVYVQQYKIRVISSHPFDASSNYIKFSNIYEEHKIIKTFMLINLGKSMEYDFETY